MTSLFPWKLKGKKVLGRRVPEIENESLKIKRLYERYLFSKKGILITRFIIDFLPGIDGKLYFLQVKHYECEKKSINDPLQNQYKRRSKRQLNMTQASCDGCFCNAAYTNLQIMQELISNLITEGNLSKNWAKSEFFLIPSKIVNDYNKELEIYE